MTRVIPSKGWGGEGHSIQTRDGEGHNNHRVGWWGSFQPQCGMVRVIPFTWWDGNGRSFQRVDCEGHSINPYYGVVRVTPSAGGIVRVIPPTGWDGEGNIFHQVGWWEGNSIHRVGWWGYHTIRRAGWWGSFHLQGGMVSVIPSTGRDCEGHITYRVKGM
jgi:hypothetical protein